MWTCNKDGSNNLKNNNFPKGRQNKLKVIANNIKVGADGEITNGEAILKDLQKEEQLHHLQNTLC